jgi:hypothetical protein
MSEDRPESALLERAGTVLAQVEATLARIEATMPIMPTKADLGGAVATAVAGLATKADLAGVAKNVDVTALGRQLREMRDELRVTSAMVLRLDHMWPDVIEQLRAMVQQQIGILRPPARARRTAAIAGASRQLQPISSRLIGQGQQWRQVHSGRAARRRDAARAEKNRAWKFC